MHVHLALHFTATVNKSVHPGPHHRLPIGFQFLTQVSKGPTRGLPLFQLCQARPLDSSVLELLQRDDGCLPFRKTFCQKIAKYKRQKNYDSAGAAVLQNVSSVFRSQQTQLSNLCSSLWGPKTANFRFSQPACSFFLGVCLSQCFCSSKQLQRSHQNYYMWLQMEKTTGLDLQQNLFFADFPPSEIGCVTINQGQQSWLLTSTDGILTNDDVWNE